MLVLEMAKAPRRKVAGAQEPARRLTAAETQRRAEDRLKAVLGHSSRVVVLDDVAEGSRATIKRARIVDPLDRLELPPRCKDAAIVFRQAYEHLDAGRSLGPMPWAKDRVDESKSADLPPSLLLATSASSWYRRGVQAMGLAASQGVINWVVICGLPLCAYDAMRMWRKGRGREELVAALLRLRDEYFPAVQGAVRSDLTAGVDICHSPSG